MFQVLRHFKYKSIKVGNCGNAQCVLESVMSAFTLPMAELSTVQGSAGGAAADSAAADNTAERHQW